MCHQDILRSKKSPPLPVTLHNPPPNKPPCQKDAFSSLATPPAKFRAKNPNRHNPTPDPYHSTISPRQAPLCMTAARLQQQFELQNSNNCMNYRLSLRVPLPFILSPFTSPSVARLSSASRPLPPPQFASGSLLLVPTPLQTRSGTSSRISNLVKLLFFHACRVRCQCRQS